MRIIHTGDWHLGARLGSQDRTADQVARLEEICRYVDAHEVDLLLVAGDVFDEHRSEPLGAIIQQLARLLKPRVEAGLTCVFVAGNHDREHVFPLLRGLQALVSPDDRRRVVFADRPRIETVRSRRGESLNLILLPYPTPSRYALAAERWPSPESKRTALAGGVRARIDELTSRARQDRGVPAILCGHFLVRGVREGLYLLTEQDDVPIEPGDLPNYAYVALGHVHRAQTVGAPHVRYCGSIERMDRGEAKNACGAVLVELTGGALAGLTELPLAATPIVHVEAGSEDELERRAGAVAEVERALVSVTLTLRRDQGPGPLMARARELFPRLYAAPELRWLDAAAAARSTAALDRRDVAGTVRSYLRDALRGDPDADALLALAEELV